MTIEYVIKGGRVIDASGETFADAVELSSALGIEAALVNGPVKMLFRRVRPVPATARPLKLRQPKTSSFPSGHASSGMFAAALVARRSQVSWPWYALGAAIVAAVGLGIAALIVTAATQNPVQATRIAIAVAAPFVLLALALFTPAAYRSQS